MCSPSRTDNEGRWIHCDLDAFKCVVCKVIAAHVFARVPMLFLPAGVRRGTVVLRATRLIPRDLLWRIYTHLCVDGVVELEQLFSQYNALKYISGLYLRATLDGIYGPRLRVYEVRARVGTYCDSSNGDFIYQMRSGVNAEILFCKYHRWYQQYLGHAFACVCVMMANTCWACCRL